MSVREEAALRPPVRDHLRSRGYRVRDEVRFNGRIADLVGVRDDRVVAVELKLRDWTTALDQARAYQVGAPFAYVALPLERARRVAGTAEGFRDAGVGLLGVEPPRRVEELLAARRSDRTLPFLAEGLREGRVGRPHRRSRP